MGECIGEFVKYNWEKLINGELKCTNKKNSCERSLCECDLDYAKKLPSSVGVFNNDYHLFWSKINWDPKQDCHRTQGKSTPECCGPQQGPQYIYNSQKKDCCSDFTIKKTGMCPSR